jgi:hypothetical protein
MATSTTGFSGGLQVPVQPDQGGGLKVIEGDQYVFQLITVLASDCDSDNPFLTMGLGLDAIFSQLSDAGWKAQQEKKIRDVFRDLERAKIAKFLKITWQAGPGPAEFTASVRYLSIETAKEGDVATTFRRAV